MNKILLIVIVLLSACGPSGSGGGQTVESYAATQAARNAGSNSSRNGITATYKLGGTACSVSITYENEGGQTEQVDRVLTNWTKSFVVHSGDYLYISAQNNCDTGSVTCEIQLNGEPTSAKSKSDGAYVIASCSGRVP